LQGRHNTAAPGFPGHCRPATEARAMSAK
jgi:hypothetical protein